MTGKGAGMTKRSAGIKMRFLTTFGMTEKKDDRVGWIPDRYIRE
jgi:hypothetical protein